jgi:hypothetical protein
LAVESLDRAKRALWSLGLRLQSSTYWNEEKDRSNDERKSKTHVNQTRWLKEWEEWFAAL